MARIDAALEWPGGKAHFFSGAQHVRLDTGTMRADPGHSNPIAGNWPGLFDRNIDAPFDCAAGTTCRISGTRFNNDPRTRGWFDCTKIGLPEG